MILKRLIKKGQIKPSKSVRNFLKLPAEDVNKIIATKKVDEVFGMLHQVGKKSVSIDEMDNVLNKRMITRFK